MSTLTLPYNLSQLNLISNYPYKITNKSKNIIDFPNKLDDKDAKDKGSPRIK